MTFQEKSILTMTTILLVVFGWYFTLILGPIASAPDRDEAYTGLLLAVVVLLVVLAVVSHVVLALALGSQAGAQDDERGRLIGLRGEAVSGYILATGVCVGLWLTIVRAEPFWIAQVLLGALVLAEIAAGVVKLALFRRGV